MITTTKKQGFLLPCYPAYWLKLTPKLSSASCFGLLSANFSSFRYTPFYSIYPVSLFPEYKIVDIITE